MSDAKQEIMDKLNEVLGELVVTALNDMAQTQKAAALHIGQLMERDEVYFTISATMPMLSAKVQMAWHGSDRAPVEIMQIQPIEKLQPH